MCDPRDFKCRSASAVAGPDREIIGTDTLLGACQAGAQSIAVGKNTESWVCELRSPDMFFFIILFSFIFIHNMLGKHSALRKLIDVVSFLQEEEPRGGLPISESGRWIWWEKKKIGAPPSSFPPSDPSAIPTSTATTPLRQKRSRYSKERWWKLPPQREFSGSEAYAVEATSMRAVCPLESRLWSQSEHAQTVCIPARLK